MSAEDVREAVETLRTALSKEGIQGYRVPVVEGRPATTGPHESFFEPHEKKALAALAALVERLEAQQAALLMGEVFERRYQRALDEWPPTKAQWEHLESVQSAFLDAYSAALHPEEQER